MDSLSTLALGQKATVSQLDISDPQRQYFEDLGFVPGVPVRALHRSPSGDPTAYDVMGAVIALRKDDARHILCNPQERSCP